MANLSARQRKALPASKFGVPSKAKSASGKARSGSFPMPDKAHARLALSMVGRSERAGHISASQAAEVRAKAHKMLGTAKKATKRK